MVVNKVNYYVCIWEKKRQKSLLLCQVCVTGTLVKQQLSWQLVCQDRSSLVSQLGCQLLSLNWVKFTQWEQIIWKSQTNEISLACWVILRNGTGPGAETMSLLSGPDRGQDTVIIWSSNMINRGIIPYILVYHLPAPNTYEFVISVSDNVSSWKDFTFWLTIKTDTFTYMFHIFVCRTCMWSSLVTAILKAQLYNEMYRLQPSRTTVRSNRVLKPAHHLLMEWIHKHCNGQRRLLLTLQISCTIICINVFIYNVMQHFMLLHVREYICVFMISSLIDAEEDEAIEKAIRHSLSEEPVQSFQEPS